MEEQLSDVLDNILGLLLLEGSYDIEEEEEMIKISIETPDAGRLIGARGESLDSLQLLVNQIMTQKMGKDGFKRVVFDVGGWRETKAQDLNERAKAWAQEVLESGKQMDLEPQSAWQRRVVHEAVGLIEGVETESVGEGRDRHIVIKLKGQVLSENTEVKAEQQDATTEES